MSADGTCQRQSNVIGPVTACSSSGTDGEYDYTLNVTSPDKNEPHVVVLLVEPSD
jgi:hypothetical protein